MIPRFSSKDQRIIRKTLKWSFFILICYHYVKNIHLMSSPLDDSSSTSLFKIQHRSHFFRKSHKYFSKAFDQSYGFFTDIPNPDWEIYCLRYQNHDRHIDGDIRNNRIHLDNAFVDKTEIQHTILIEGFVRALFCQSR